LAARLTASMSWMFKGKSPTEGYAAARRLGLDAVEHSFPYETTAIDTASLLRDNGLELSFMIAPCRFHQGERGYACVPGREADFRRGIDKALAYASAVGCRTLGILAGEIPVDRSRDPFLDVLASNLEHAAGAAAAVGVNLSIEPICSQRIPCFALNTLEQAAQILDRVDKPNMGLCLDTFHVSMERGSLIESFDKFADRINYIQLANIPLRNGPGEGELDLAFFTRHILNNGFDGFISCEYAPDRGLDANTTLAWATQFIDQGKLRALLPQIAHTTERK
jgi:hydroxypyruvate isomerase